MEERFLGLLLFAMEAEQTLPRFGSRAAELRDASFRLRDLRGSGLRAHGELCDSLRKDARFSPQRTYGLKLRRAPRFPLRSLRVRLVPFRGDLTVTRGQLFGALTIEDDAVLAAIDFERSEVQHVLVLANLCVERINALVEPVLLAFPLLNALGMLRFVGGEFFQGLRQALRLGIELARLAGEHLADDAAHLVANLGVAASLTGLALQRAELFFDFDDDVVDAREIDFRGFQLGFGQTFFGLELGDAGSFFDDGAALHGFGGEDQTDAALFNYGVGIGAEADAHEHFLNVAQPRRAAVDQVFALAGPKETPADDDFTGLRR